MNKNVFRASAGQLAQYSVGLSKALDGIQHQGVKGQLREAIMNQLFAPFLPPDIQTVTGNLIAVNGSQSPQVDAILHAPSILPAFLLERSGLVPIEACLYAIEIKSKLTAAELRKSIRSAELIGKMPLLPPWHFTPSPNKRNAVASSAGPAYPPIRAIFAFGSDLKGDPDDEIARYRKYDPMKGTLPAIQAICIIGRGYWTADGDGKWSRVHTDDEALGFLGGVVNTIPHLRVAKGHPQFGHYLLDNIPLGAPF